MREETIYCDRCGSTITEDTMVELKVAPGEKTSAIPETFELCEECYAVVLAEL